MPRGRASTAAWRVVRFAAGAAQGKWRARTPKEEEGVGALRRFDGSSRERKRQFANWLSWRSRLTLRKACDGVEQGA
jgi:hypothetical protein